MAEGPVFRKTILIGLGGAGRLIVTHMKRLLLDTYGTIPPCIKLWSLDTDDASDALRSVNSDKEYKLDEHEKLYLDVPNPMKFVQESPDIQQWYSNYKRMPASAIKHGAGAVRQNGRLALFAHLQDFERHFEKMRTELDSMGMDHHRMREAGFRLSEKPTEVYVCGSLAGGTGSGTFLDIGILARERMRNALLYGFFLLDWVYADKSFAYRVGGNVYAALTELDFLESVKPTAGGQGRRDGSEEPYTPKYGTKTVAVTHAPYDLVNLVDGRNEYGENIHDSGHLCETVAQAIFLSVGTMGDHVTSVVDNLRTHIHVDDPRKWNGRHARYSSFGVSSAYYPIREMVRLVSAENALQLCEEALDHAKQALGDQAGQAQTITQIHADADALMGQAKLNLLNREHVLTRICPVRRGAAVEVQPFELDAPDFPAGILASLEKKKASQEAKLDESYAENGGRYRDEIWGDLEQAQKIVEDTPPLGQVNLRAWIEQVLALLGTQKSAATDELHQLEDKMRAHETNAAGILENAEQTRTGFGRKRQRRKFMRSWEGEINNYLKGMDRKKRIDFEVEVYNAIIEKLKKRMPVAETEPAQKTIDLLNKTYGKLKSLVAAEITSMSMIKAKPNQVVVGDGIWYVLPSEVGQQRLDMSTESLRTIFGVSFDEFKDEHEVLTVEDYLKVHDSTQKANREAKREELGLVTAMREYCEGKFEPLLQVGVQEALNTIGLHQGEDKRNKSEESRKAFVSKVFHDLIRCSAALWSFDRAKLRPDLQPNYDKILNFGLYSAEEGEEKYEGFVQDAKRRRRINSDHRFTTTRDPYRIWVLNYAAALPAYFLDDLPDKRARYEEVMTPSYHAAEYFEREAPDLFPVADEANTALRVLGMAIVKGLDVIRDDKLEKGHRFTLKDAGLKTMFAEDERVWDLFREMHEETMQNEALLDLLKGLLKVRVEQMTADELESAIRAQINKLEAKFKDRDFSRLISSRLTYREIKELKLFLEPTGYNREISRYLTGQRVRN